jgi:hypothetical protein
MLESVKLGPKCLSVTNKLAYHTRVITTTVTNVLHL